MIHIIDFLGNLKKSRDFTEYAYALAVGGIIYTITDVEELGEWMKSCLESHPLFEDLTLQELKDDPIVKLLCTVSAKITRSGIKFYLIMTEAFNQPTQYQ